MIDLSSGGGQGISSIIEEEKNQDFKEPIAGSDEGGLRNSETN